MCRLLTLLCAAAALCVGSARGLVVEDETPCPLPSTHTWMTFSGKCRCLGCGPDGPKLCGPKGLYRDSEWCKQHATSDTGAFKFPTLVRPTADLRNTPCARARVEAEPTAGGVFIDAAGVVYPMAWNVGPPPQCGVGRHVTKELCLLPHCEWEADTATCVHSARFYGPGGHCPTCKCMLPVSTDGACTAASGARVVGRHCMCDEEAGTVCGTSGTCIPLPTR